MENKLNLITELAISTVVDFANKRGAWPAFLQTAARIYKYPFYDQLLIYAQRPDATACAPIEIWNTRMKRWVKRGAKGIALIDHTGGAQKLRYVFDVSDTYAGRSDSVYPQMWAAKNEFKAGIIEDLAKSFGEVDSKARTFELELMSISANAVNDRYAYLRYDLVEALEGSYMEDLDELNIDVICKRLIASVKQDYNTAVSKPVDPTRTGYTFGGWYTDSELTSAVTWPLTIGAEDVTLYAKWTINPYRVIFESNGGSLVAAIAQAYGTTVVEPTPPTRTGYTFAGWYADSVLKKAVTWPLTIGACDTTLYAAWRAIPYTICFESNGGSSVSSITQGYGTTVAEPEKPTRGGYTFAGWYTDSELKKAVSWPLTVAEGNITLYAAWTMDQSSGPGEITPVPNYTVSFDSNDGSTVISRTILSGDQLTEPAAPSKPGYTFEGWYKDSACTIPWDFSEKITKNITLYAKWSADISNTKYTVSFESNGAIIGEQTVSHGKTVRMPSEPKRKGYEFAGWFKNKSLKNPWIFSDDVVTNSITLYAKWVAETKDDDKPVTGSQKDNDKPTSRPQKGNNRTPGITSSKDRDNENLDPQPNKSKDDRDKELEITGGRRESKAETALATDDGASTYSFKDILLFSGAVIAAILLLILCVCLLFSKVRSKSKKEVYFYENNSMICSAKIRRDKVDVTKAISGAAGPKLKVKINDDYAEKAFGRDIYFYFKGKAIGTMTIDGDNSFEIAIN